jgi:hypothetical protein
MFTRCYPASCTIADPTQYFCTWESTVHGPLSSILSYKRITVVYYYNYNRGKTRPVLMTKGRELNATAL